MLSKGSYAYQYRLKSSVLESFTLFPEIPSCYRMRKLSTPQMSEKYHELNILTLAPHEIRLRILL